MFVDNNMNFPKPYRITKADTVTKSYMGIGIMTLILVKINITLSQIILNL